MQSYTTKVYYANFFGPKSHFNRKYDGFANYVYVLQGVSERFANYTFCKTTKLPRTSCSKKTGLVKPSLTVIISVPAEVFVNQVWVCTQFPPPK